MWSVRVAAIKVQCKSQQLEIRLEVAERILTMCEDGALSVWAGKSA